VTECARGKIGIKRTLLNDDTVMKIRRQTTWSSCAGTSRPVLSEGPLRGSGERRPAERPHPPQVHGALPPRLCQGSFLLFGDCLDITAGFPPLRLGVHTSRAGEHQLRPGDNDLRRLDALSVDDVSVDAIVAKAKRLGLPLTGGSDARFVWQLRAKRMLLDVPHVTFPALRAPGLQGGTQPEAGPGATSSRGSGSRPITGGPRAPACERDAGAILPPGRPRLPSRQAQAAPGGTLTSPRASRGRSPRPVRSVSPHEFIRPSPGIHLSVILADDPSAAHAPAPPGRGTSNITGCSKRPDIYPRCPGGSGWGVGALGRSLRRTRRTPRSALRAPPCIWTFLSSLGLKGSFSSLLGVPLR
jgi:hypothetical protein